MDPIDHSKASQVWQRVTAPPKIQQSQEALRTLLLRAMEQDAALKPLPPVLSGRVKTLAQKLTELRQATTACLGGLYRLSGGSSLPREPSSRKESLRQALTRSFHLAKQAASEYTARSVDPEYGLVFHELAQREASSCTLIAQLLGELP